MRNALNSIPLLLLILLWGFTIVHYTDLPESIPIHFNALGEPDGFGPRSYAWGVPLIASLLYLFLNFLQDKIGLTKETKNTYLGLQGAIVCIFGYIQLQSFLVALGRSDGLGKGFLPLCSVLLLMPFLSKILWKSE